MDRFKHFIQNNKAAFDVERPGTDLKTKVFNSLQRQNRLRSIGQRWFVAASILLLCSCLYLYNQVSRPSVSPEIASRNKERSKENPVLKQPPPVAVPSGDPVHKLSEGRVQRLKGERRPTRQTENGSGYAVSAPAPYFDREYEQQIKIQEEQVKSLPVFASDGKAFESYTFRYQALSQRADDLNAAIKKEGMDKDFLEEMLRIYSGKMDLLLRLRLEIKEQNHRSGSDSIPHRTYYINL